MAKPVPIHEYFPSESYRGTGKFRNIFSSYGALRQIQVKCDGDAFSSLCQKQLPQDQNKRFFAAVAPSMPLFPPVDLRECREEPCLAESKRHNEEQQNTFRDLKKNLNFQSDVVTCGNATSLTNVIGTDISKQRVNKYYAGGVLKYQSLNVPEYDGVLIYPTGPQSDMLASILVKSGTQRPIINNRNSTKPLEGGRIYGVDVLSQNGEVVILTRSLDTIHILSLKKAYESTHTKRILRKVFFKDKSTLQTSAVLNPFSMCEFASIDTLGVCELRSFDAHCKSAVLTLQGESRFECNDPFWQCSWGMHPRQLILTDRTGVALFDVRRQSNHSSLDLFTLPNAILNAKDRIFVSKPYLHGSNYHMVGTEHNLILLDQRFPNHTVSKWGHLLLSPPLYMEFIYDLIKGLSSSAEATSGMDESQMDIVLLGCQEHPECHALPLSPASNSKPPIWTDDPWRISKPSDISQLSGFCPMFPEEDTRLTAPLIGVSGATTETGFTIFQMTSFGEVFQQTYNESHKKKDKSFNAGLGSRDLKLHDVTAKQCCDWLLEAEQRWFRKEGTIKHINNKTKLNLIFEGLQNHNEKSHTGCMFCKDCEKETSSRSDTCHLCTNNVEHSQLVYDGLQKNQWPLLPNTTQGAKENENSAVQLLEKKLSGICLNKTRDITSKILLKLWNFEEVIPVELLKRREKEFLTKHPELLDKTPGRMKEENETEDLFEQTDADTTDEAEDQSFVEESEIENLQIKSEAEETGLQIETFSLEALLATPLPLSLSQNVGQDELQNGFESSDDTKRRQDFHLELSSDNGSEYVPGTPKQQGLKRKRFITHESSMNTHVEPIIATPSQLPIINAEDVKNCFDNLGETIDMESAVMNIWGSSHPDTECIFAHDNNDLQSLSQTSLVTRTESPRRKVKAKKRSTMGF